MRDMNPFPSPQGCQHTACGPQMALRPQSIRQFASEELLCDGTGSMKRGSVMVLAGSMHIFTQLLQTWRCRECQTPKGFAKAGAGCGGNYNYSKHLLGDPLLFFSNLEDAHWNADGTHCRASVSKTTPKATTTKNWKRATGELCGPSIATVLHDLAPATKLCGSSTSIRLQGSGTGSFLQKLILPPPKLFLPRTSLPRDSSDSTTSSRATSMALPSFLVNLTLTHPKLVIYSGCGRGTATQLFQGIRIPSQVAIT